MSLLQMKTSAIFSVRINVYTKILHQKEIQIKYSMSGLLSKCAVSSLPHGQSVSVGIVLGKAGCH